MRISLIKYFFHRGMFCHSFLLSLISFVTHFFLSLISFCHSFLFVTHFLNRYMQESTQKGGGNITLFLDTRYCFFKPLTENIYLYNKNMNEYYYYVILCRYIDRKDRVICSRRDRHLIVHKFPRRNALMATIFIHLGSPCYRYCICKYFNEEDRVEMYERLHITESIISNLHHHIK